MKFAGLQILHIDSSANSAHRGKSALIDIANSAREYANYARAVLHLVDYTYYPYPNPEKVLDFRLPEQTNKLTNNLVEVYPNPAKDLLTIKLVTTDKINLRIEDITGRVLKTFAFEDEAITETLDISDLKNGLYLIVTTDRKNNYIQRIKFEKIK